tara:strand:+ start:11491 stop:11856 length:366 start_codon:yes stop_codon:yes gene_type:complete
MNYPLGLHLDEIWGGNLHRTLTEEEKPSFRQWARDNWKVGDKVLSVWHPVVQEECAQILDKHIRKHTKEYDSGTLDWNFAYGTSVIALDSSDPISKEEQFEMAVEYFWETEWEEAINNVTD